MSHRYKKEFPRVFKGLGKLKNVYKLHLNETAQPFSIAIPKRLPLPMKQKVQPELKPLEKVGNCSVCEKERKYPPKPLLSSELPDYPWQKVGMDLFELKGHTYLIIIDNYSRWIEVSPLQKTNSGNIVNNCKSVFSRNGIPELLISDNGLQFISKVFLDFSNRFGFVHLTNSPHYPQGNGEAERALQTIKNLFKKGK